MKQLNARAAPPMPPISRLDAAALRQRMRDGATVVDTRPPSEFLDHHLEGSIGISLGRSFLTWAGSVLDPARDLVLLMAPDTLHEADAVVRDLALIGYDRVLGALPASDLKSFAPRPVATIRSVPASHLIRLGEHATVLDVRSATEWNEGHVPGAMHVPLTELSTRLAELRGRQTIVTYCQSGARSATAASLLRAAGFTDVLNAEGGFDAWLRGSEAAIGAEIGR
jgi:hydroxyacylglutathione hydrolase